MFCCYGSFQAKGASICDVYIVSSSAFHDRRIPVPVSALLYDFRVKLLFLVNSFSVVYLSVQVLDLYGVGMRKAFPTPNLIKELNLKVYTSFVAVFTIVILMQVFFFIISLHLVLMFTGGTIIHW